VRAQPEQLRHPLDRSGAVKNDLSAGRVIKPLGKVAQREGQAFQPDEVLHDETGILYLLPQLLGTVAVTGEPAGHAVVEPPAILDDTNELREERRTLVKAFPR
jgi:hypothetical protein